MRQLCEVARVIKGVSYDKAEAHDESEENHVPILRAGNITDKLRLDDDLVWVPSGRVATEQYLKRDDIVICMSSGSASVVGKSAISEASWSGSVGAFCAIIRPNSDYVHPSFVAYYLRTPAFRDWASRSQGINIKNIKKSDLETFQLPVPPISTQQRIVDILDRASAIQRLRKAADDKIRELVPALFVDMFGDPATNSKGWETKKFGEVGSLDRGKSRHRPRDAKELYGGPYPFVQTGDVANSGGYINRYSSTYSELGLAQSRLWGAGTLCITIAANIAKTGILEIEACFPDSVVGFTPNHLVLTEFVRAWLWFLQPILEKNAPQAAQKNINLEILRELEIPVPPLSLQERFDGLCRSLRSTTLLANDALELSEAISAAISASSFR